MKNCNIQTLFNTDFECVDFEKRYIFDGIKYRVLFKNNYGARIIRHNGSYGNEDGLWELAVIDSDGRIRYDTVITDDVVGWLNEEGVVKILKQISQL